jgi:hypothetical protein
MKAGDSAHARALLARAEASVPYEQDIDQPGVYAYLAGGWAAASGQVEASRLYDRALDGAEKLANPRPRALAAVEICRSLGRAGIALDDALRTRLWRLLQNLKSGKR